MFLKFIFVESCVAIVYFHCCINHFMIVICPVLLLMDIWFVLV